MRGSSLNTNSTLPLMAEPLVLLIQRSYTLRAVDKFTFDVDPEVQKLLRSDLTPALARHMLMQIARANDVSELRRAIYDCISSEVNHRATTVKRLHRPKPNQPCPCGSEKKFKKCCRISMVPNDQRTANNSPDPAESKKFQKWNQDGLAKEYLAEK